MPEFIKIVAGPESYFTGGFTISVGEFERIRDANVEMHPDTILGTTIVAGFEVEVSTVNASVVVKVDTIVAGGTVDPAGAVGAWKELADSTTGLDSAKFILSGNAI